MKDLMKDIIYSAIHGNKEGDLRGLSKATDSRDQLYGHLDSYIFLKT